MARASLLLGLACLAALFLTATEARARDLVVDLSEPVVRVTTGFSGSTLLLYGVATQPPEMPGQLLPESQGDIIVVVRGPQKDTLVRRKERVGGIWINRESMTFASVPGFYSLASNRPLADILGDDIRAYHQIGVENLEITPLEAATEAQPDNETQAFRDALLRGMTRDGLYSATTGNLLFLGGGLFRTRISFPANAPIGTYGIDVYLVRGNDVSAFETTLLSVRKFGLEAEIYDLAHRHSLAYGVLAILIAAGAGWAASVAFRKT